MSTGILVGEKDVKGEIQYDSRKPRLQIAIDREPQHLGIFETKGASLVSSVGNGYYLESVLLTFKHNLGYKPRVLMYTYSIDTNQYYCGEFFFAVGVVDDLIQYRVTEDTFTIVQILNDPFNIGYSSAAATAGKLRIKYSIFSNPVNNVTPENKRS